MVEKNDVKEVFKRRGSDSFDYVEYSLNLEDMSDSLKANTPNKMEQNIKNPSNLLSATQEQRNENAAEYISYEETMRQMKNRRELQYNQLKLTINEAETKIDQIKKELQAFRNFSEETGRAHIYSDPQDRKFNEYLVYKNYELSKDLRKAMNTKQEKYYESDDFLETRQNQETIDNFLNYLSTKTSADARKLTSDKFSKYKTMNTQYASKNTNFSKISAGIIIIFFLMFVFSVFLNFSILLSSNNKRR